MNNHTLFVLFFTVCFSNISLQGQEVTQIFEGTDTLFVLPSDLNYQQLTKTNKLKDYELPDGKYRQYLLNPDVMEGEKAEPIAIFEFDVQNECLNGLFQKSNKEGKLLKSGNYLTGQQHGYWYEYSDSIDIIMLKTYFEFGATREVVFYTALGKKQRRLIYFNESPSNKKVLTTWYFPNGHLAMQGITQVETDGKRMAQKTGQWRAWYMEGNLRYIEYYSEGVQNGLCEYFRQNGSLSRESFYKKGKLKKEIEHPEIEIKDQGVAQALNSSTK